MTTSSGITAELRGACGDWLADNEDAMAEHGWMRLPLDEDGEPVCVGDVMEWPNGDTSEVVGIGDGGTLFYVENNNAGGADWTTVVGKRHHRPDTWERIIEDAIRGDGGSYGCLEERFNATVPALVARCKALAGDAE